MWRFRLKRFCLPLPEDSACQLLHNQLWPRSVKSPKFAVFKFHAFPVVDIFTVLNLSKADFRKNIKKCDSLNRHYGTEKLDHCYNKGFNNIIVSLTADGNQDYNIRIISSPNIIKPNLISLFLSFTPHIIIILHKKYIKPRYTNPRPICYIIINIWPI